MDINTDLHGHFDTAQLIINSTGELEKLADGVYGVRSVIPIRLLESFSSNDFLRDQWENLYEAAVRLIAKQIYGCSNWLTFSLACVSRPVSGEFLELAIIVNLFVVGKTEIVLPVISYKVSSNGYMPREWRCGYCGLPNEMQATYCGERHTTAAGCGHHRLRLIQEQ